MSENAGPKSAKIVGSARNATRILQWLSRQERPVRLAEVSGTLAINPSTCLNILHTLAEDGFVVVRDKSYALGPETVNLAYRALGTQRHAWTIPGTILAGTIALVGGQWAFERVLGLAGSLSMIVEFVGGITFIILLLAGGRRR